MKTQMKRLACLLVVLALVPGLISGLAEEHQTVGQGVPVFLADDLNLIADEGNAGVSSNDANGDIIEKKEAPVDSPEKKLSAKQIKAAEALNGNVKELTPKTGTFEYDGKTYYDLIDGTPEEKREVMKTISQKDLFYKLLTKKLDGADLFNSVWLPVATATLLGGGYNNFYRVDDYWSPETFKDAFLLWDSTWCSYKSTTAGFTNLGFILYEMYKGKKYEYATDFQEVGEFMKQSVKDNSDYIYKGLTGDLAAYDHILDNWKAPDYQGDILFVPFTEVIHRGASWDESSGHMGYAWDSFAVCFYDLKLNPMTDYMQTGVNNAGHYYYHFDEDANKAVALSQNKGAEEQTLTGTRTDSETTTVSTTLSTSRTLSFTEGSNISYTYGWGDQESGPWKNTVTIGFNFSSTQSETSSKSRTTGTSNTRSSSWTISGKTKPSTQAVYTLSSSTSTGAIAYSCPVEFQYKVAILSLCGDYSGALPYRTVNVTHAGTCRIFGEKNGDAMADLADRLRNPNTDNFHLDFSQNSYYTFQKQNVNANRFYSSVGGTNTFTVQQSVTSASVLTPLNPLKKTQMPPDQVTYIINYSEDRPEQNRLGLATLPVEGVAVVTDENNNGIEVPYYGFSPAKGQWKMVDEEGNVIKSSDYAEINTTQVGTFLVAKKPSRTPIYLKYFINDNTYPKDPLSNKEKYLKNSDLSASAVVEVYIRDYIDSGKSEGTVIYLNKKGKNPDAMVYVGEEVTIVPTFADDRGWKVTGMKSSNKKVAKVLGDGEVKPRKKGKATITATAKNGKKEITAKVKLIVVGSNVPYNISIDQGNKLSLGLYERGVQLTVSALPSEASNAVKWKSSKETVVKVDANGVLTPVKKGKAVITATSKLNKMAMAVINVTVVSAETKGNEALSLELEAPTLELEAPTVELEVPTAELEVSAQAESEDTAQVENDDESELIVSEGIEEAIELGTVELNSTEY